MQVFTHLLDIAGIASIAFAVETDVETPKENKITISVHFTPQTNGDLVGIVKKALGKKF